MTLEKCPKCEINYLQEGEKYCEVCRRAMKGGHETDELSGVCIECGESPVVRGTELCAACLREKRHQEKLEKMVDERVLPDSIDLEDVELDEIEVPIENDIPESEMEEIDKELGDNLDVEDEEESEDDEEE